MMPLEDQVCSLEQAKKLAELLGDDAPESLWVWEKISDPVLKTSVWVLVLQEKIQKYLTISVRAYTGDEVGVILPKFLQKGIWEGDLWEPNKFIVTDPNNADYELCMLYNTRAGFNYGYMESGDIEVLFERTSQCEVRAKADLLIYLIEHKIIKPEDLKL